MKDNRKAEVKEKGLRSSKLWNISLLFKIQMEFRQANGSVPISIPLKPEPSSPPFSDQYDPLEVQISELLARGRAPFVVVGEQNLRRECSCSQGGDIQKKILTYNRKEKSLAELSKKFLNKFQGANSSVLALDQVTVDLKVQRRRIYDIINIMESLGVVSKIKKNLYQWKGLARAIQTIQLYKEGFVPHQKQKSKKQKSLESLAGQFLGLFLTYNPVLTLEEATGIILADADEKMKKTKIRRLYDIVNVFKCLGLVNKIHIDTGKSGFEWAGIDRLKQIIEERKYAQIHGENDENLDWAKSEQEEEDFDEMDAEDKNDLQQDEGLETFQKRENKLERRDTTILADPPSNHRKEENYFMSEEKKADSSRQTPVPTKIPTEVKENFSYFSIVMKTIDKEGEKSISGLFNELSGILWPEYAMR